MTRFFAFAVCLLWFAGCSPERNSDHQKEISERILLDFRKTEDQIRKQLYRYYPVLTDSLLNAWESDGRLEMKKIDGQKRYFNYAVNNLFRIDPEARRVRDSLYPPKPDPLDSIRLTNTRDIISAVETNNNASLRLAETLKFTIEYTVTVDKDAVPAGETIRCWLPFPRESTPRQSHINLISSNPMVMAPSSPNTMHSTLYSTRQAVAGEPTVFSYQGSFEISGQWFDPTTLTPADQSDLPRSLRKYTKEIPSQVIFSTWVKHLADSLAGAETNPYRIIRSFYYWIDQHIPWASAREYSTMDSIPDYVLTYRHGDCGMVTFLMMSMARYKGIPARWQSGWMLHPGSENLHDWCEVWFKETGWIPLDMSFGLQQSEDPLLREFYITGIDSYRMIVNDDFGRELDPAKKYFRSEPYDFQRGEVEWKEGNLYFNVWDYHLKVLSIEKIIH